jgi:hypothetical protein
VAQEPWLETIGCLQSWAMVTTPHSARHRPKVHLVRGLLPGPPGGEGVTSAAGEVPNSREMMPRRWGGAGAEGCAGWDGVSTGGKGDVGSAGGQGEGILRGS